MMTKEEYLAKVKQLITDGWNTAPDGGLKSADEAICWTSAYFQAEEAQDLNMRETANLWLTGLPAIDTVDKAMEYWDLQYEIATQEDAEDEESLESSLERIKQFWA